MSSMDNYYNQLKTYSSNNTNVVIIVIATLLVLWFINRKINSLERTVKDTLFFMATTPSKKVPE